MICYSAPLCRCGLRGHATATFAGRSTKTDAGRLAAIGRLEQELGAALEAASGRAYQLVLNAANVDLGRLREEARIPEKQAELTQRGSTVQLTVDRELRALRSVLGESPDDAPWPTVDEEADRLRIGRVQEAYAGLLRQAEATGELPSDLSERELLTRTRRLWAQAQQAVGEVTPAERFRAARSLAARRTRLAVELEAAQATARNEIESVLLALQQQGAVAVLEDIGAVTPAQLPREGTLAGGLFDAEELEAARRVSASLLGQMYTGLGERMATTISQGLDRGLSDSQIAERLAYHLPEGLQKHAYILARTETTRVYNLGRVNMGMDARRYVWGYRYDVVLDTNTTDICQALAGKLVPLDELRYIPPLHYNCRTTLTPIMRAEFGGPANPKSTVPERVPADDLWIDPVSPDGAGDLLRAPADLPPMGAN